MELIKVNLVAIEGNQGKIENVRMLTLVQEALPNTRLLPGLDTAPPDYIFIILIVWSLPTDHHSRSQYHPCHHCKCQDCITIMILFEDVQQAPTLRQLARPRHALSAEVKKVTKNR